MKREKIQIDIPAELKQELKDEAKENGVVLSFYIRYILSRRHELKKNEFFK